MPRSMMDKLSRFYDRFAGNDQVLVVINADPDAIASAMAVKRLLWRKVAAVTLSNINIVDRPDNIAMIRLLGIKLSFIEDVDTEKFNRFVMVDSQPAHHEDFSRFHFDVIIDHHPDTAPQAPFVDIRPKYGATATILTEYLRTAKIKPSAKLASGLFHAIKTDTSNFERQTLIEDIRAFQFLFHHANIHIARKIELAEMRLDYLSYFRKALQGMHMRRNRVFVHLGAVINPDVCVVIADFFMRVASIDWSIISGIFDDKLVLIFRNDGLNGNAGKIANASFGDVGSAGGHESMARAEIPLPNLKGLVDHHSDPSVLNWIIAQMDRDKKTCPGK